MAKIKEKKSEPKNYLRSTNVVLLLTDGYLCQFLPCRNFHFTTKLDGKNCINTVLGVVASTELDTKHKKNELKILKRGF